MPLLVQRGEDAVALDNEHEGHESRPRFETHQATTSVFVRVTRPDLQPEHSRTRL